MQADTANVALAACNAFDEPAHTLGLLLQVYFCDRQCQLAAHPIHKHYCTEPDLRKYALDLKVLVCAYQRASILYAHGLTNKSALQLKVLTDGHLLHFQWSYTGTK